MRLWIPMPTESNPASRIRGLRIFGCCFICFGLVNYWVLLDDFVVFDIWLLGFSYYPINLSSYGWPEPQMNLNWEKKGKDEDTLKLNLNSTGRQLLRGESFLRESGKAVCPVGRCKEKRADSFFFGARRPVFSGMRGSHFLSDAS